MDDSSGITFGVEKGTIVVAINGEEVFLTPEQADGAIMLLSLCTEVVLQGGEDVTLH